MNNQYDFFQILEKDIKMDATLQGVSLETEVCPICGEDLIINGRCKTCYSCGWSSCDL
jgi:hypothetical protein